MRGLGSPGDTSFLNFKRKRYNGNIPIESSCLTHRHSHAFIHSEKHRLILNHFTLFHFFLFFFFFAIPLIHFFLLFWRLHVLLFFLFWSLYHYYYFLSLLFYWYHGSYFIVNTSHLYMHPSSVFVFALLLYFFFSIYAPSLDRLFEGLFFFLISFWT